MSSLENRLHEALVGEAGSRPPSPDLFARVAESIEDDRARRRRLRIVIAGWLVAAAALGGFALWVSLKEGGMSMPWWVLEIATNVVLIGIAMWLGPFIKRFGRAYAADVFHDNPLTGKSYIVLTDVVYYLLFTAYILFTVRLEPQLKWFGDANAEQLKESLMRIGGILLIIGVLHGINIVLMPMLGRLFSLNRRLPDRIGRD
jgi:hypothetical protein